MSKYNKLKSNQVYKNHKLWNETNFCDFMIATLIAKDKNNIIGPLQYVKLIKDETQLGLKYCKEWYDLLRDLGFIINDFNIPIFKIKEEIEEINSMDDLVYIIDHEINIEQFLRITKIKKIKNKIVKK